jgi:hypothetical protein
VAEEADVARSTKLRKTHIDDDSSTAVIIANRAETSGIFCRQSFRLARAQTEDQYARE